MKLGRTLFVSCCVAAILLSVVVQAAEENVAKRRRKVKRVKKVLSSERRSDEEDPAARSARLIGAAFGLHNAAAAPPTYGDETTSYDASTSSAPGSAYYAAYPAVDARLAIPYEVTANDLLALEQHQQQQQQEYLAEEGEELEDPLVSAAYPYNSDEYRQQLLDYHYSYGDPADDKTLGQVQQAVGGFVGSLTGAGEGDDGQQGGGGILNALTPVLVTGILAVGLSSVFANQVKMRSSN